MLADPFASAALLLGDSVPLQSKDARVLGVLGLTFFSDDELFASGDGDETRDDAAVSPSSRGRLFPPRGVR